MMASLHTPRVNSTKCSDHTSESASFDRVPSVGAATNAEKRRLIPLKIPAIVAAAGAAPDVEPSLSLVYLHSHFYRLVNSQFTQPFTGLSIYCVPTQPLLLSLVNRLLTQPIFALACASLLTQPLLQAYL